MTAASTGDCGTGAPDVLRLLRTATAAAHEQVERTLDLMAPGLDRPRLVRAMRTLHGFWAAAEEGLDAWARDAPADAGRLDWSHRRRAGLYADDVRALGGVPGTARPPLPAVPDTDAAIGRMYVLEGATLGGTFIDRHLATLPVLAGVRLRAFSPYGPRTGAMWHAYRAAARTHVEGDGDTGRVIGAACATFDALVDWCAAERVQI
jgi:heme oxygenase (biliverdin-IX-beta and delta-forming)